MSTTPAATVRAARSATGRDRRGAEPTQAEGRARAGRSRSRSASPGPGHTADEAAGGVNDARPASDQADAVEAHNAAFILEDMQQRRGEATNHGLTDAANHRVEAAKRMVAYRLNARDGRRVERALASRLAVGNERDAFQDGLLSAVKEATRPMGLESGSTPQQRVVAFDMLTSVMEAKARHSGHTIERYRKCIEKIRVQLATMRHIVGAAIVPALVETFPAHITDIPVEQRAMPISAAVVLSVLMLLASDMIPHGGYVTDADGRVSGRNKKVSYAKTMPNKPYEWTTVENWCSQLKMYHVYWELPNPFDDPRFRVAIKSAKDLAHRVLDASRQFKAAALSAVQVGLCVADVNPLEYDEMQFACIMVFGLAFFMTCEARSARSRESARVRVDATRAQADRVVAARPRAATVHQNRQGER